MGIAVSGSFALEESHGGGMHEPCLEGEMALSGDFIRKPSTSVLIKVSEGKGWLERREGLGC